MYIADLSGGLFFGSWHTTQHNCLLEHKIDNVFHITIDPTPLLDCVRYELIDVDDNSQSADKMFNQVLPELLPKIDKLLQNNKNVLLCCSMGKSRSATVVMAYLMKYRDMTYNDAISYIKERRDININVEFAKRLSLIKPFNI